MFETDILAEMGIMILRHSEQIASIMYRSDIGTSVIPKLVHLASQAW